MNRLFLLAAILLSSGITQGQVLQVMPGTDLTIQAGTVFKMENMALIPSADFTISNNMLSKSSTAIHPSSDPYISRVYLFSDITNPYSGSVLVNYSDGKELNGIAENQLSLTINNGTTWNTWPGGTGDAASNYVQTVGISNVKLNELTLGNLSTPLPLIWLSFNAVKENQTALLQWATAYSQNTKNFTLQHSINGSNWTGITSLPATGKSSNVNNYSFIHTNPLTGINYYRLLQTDMQNRNSYSAVKSLKFTASEEKFLIIGNPVTNDILTIQVSNATGLTMFTADGKLLFQEAINAGTKNIDVSRYAKGTYLLKANGIAKKVVIQ